ncbi:hypothetical protein M9H77_01603 [Catharanthus roseus]|uniref:Uncharacterized protein n=1 Tax=Catharanthus roseus TaxID=4058 RepID=A0ACC0C630_CATRO|nr:hypothetical protein M9H77_01603 [Catharanthus roseus]
MDWLNCVDFCCSMLFEATADSEADSDVNKNMDHALLRDDNGLAEDDALSCSFDDEFDLISTADLEFDQIDEQHEEVIKADDSESENVADDDDDDDEEEQGEFNQIGNGNVVGRKTKKDLNSNWNRGVFTDSDRRLKKLKVCGDSMKQELMNERDKDKLFWETCLAS